MLRSIKLLNTVITSEKEEKILEYVVDQVTDGTKKLFITTPNPEILVYAQAHPDYQKKLNEAEVSLPDGVGLMVGGYLIGKPIQERITGTDFIEKLCLACREKPMSMGFLGGRGGVAELTAERLVRKYPWLQIKFVGEEWGEAGFNFEKLNQESRIKNQGKKEIDILFVAMGAPKQEEWIYENLSHIPVKAAMGVGGAFDYISGRVARAPKLVRIFGLEWLFRLIVQPWRWRRQLALIQFILLMVKQRFTGKE